jgi:hypothetical protein
VKLRPVLAAIILATLLVPRPSTAAPPAEAGGPPLTLGITMNCPYGLAG